MNTSRLYLRRLHMAAFGRFFDASVGPFSPGFNVVYGKNEAGKTTISSFIGGVLFGWEDARGQKNVYKPEIARRSGTLFFADRDTGDACDVSRTRNAEGALFSPSDASSLLDTVDKDTFKTMFSLTSDELRSLEGAADMTSKLLTAGSGSNVSPAAVLADLDRKIAAFTSRSASAEESFVRILSEEEECKRLLADARAVSDGLKEEYREYASLSANYNAASDKLSRLNERLEGVSSARADIVRIDAAMEEERRRMDASAARLASDISSHTAPAPLFGEEEEAHILAVLERLQSDEERLARRVDSARTAFAAARAQAKEGFGFDEDGEEKHPPFLVAAFACALVGFAGAVCVAAFAIGGNVPAAAVSAVLAALGAAGAAWFAFAFRRLKEKRSTEGPDRAVSRTRAILEACEEDERAFVARVEEELESLGLGQAQGSVARARAILESSRENRLAADVCERIRSQAASQRSYSEQMLDGYARRRAELFARYGIAQEQGVSAFEQLEESLRVRRDQSVEGMRASAARLGELKQILRDGAQSSELDLLKTRQAQINTRKEEAAAHLAELLIARRALTQALDSWKSESVPEVYRRASELLSLMTDGKWAEVRMEEDGTLVAVDAVRRRLEPRFLSTGTCQQLYLALRIALLECASDVGAGIPVLADDILVNFDDERRIGAVKALAQLARTRQVILFTCHKEILHVIQRYADDCAVVTL